MQAKGEHTYTYRLHWGPDVPKSTSLARFLRTGVGAKGDDARIFVLDLIGDRLKSVDPNSIRGNVTAEKAEIKNIVTQPNPATGGWRLSFELSVKEKVAGRVARLADAGQRRHIGGLGLSMDTLTQRSQVAMRQRGCEQRFLPAESPLPMSTQQLQAFRARRRGTSALAPSMALRRACIFAGTAALTAAGCYEMYEVLQVGGVTVLEWMVLVLFVLLFAWVAFSFMSALAGFVVLLFRTRDPLGIDPDAPLPPISSRNAMLLPTYNEDPYRIMARLRAMLRIRRADRLRIAASTGLC